MGNICEVLTVLMTCFICVYSYFSALSISSGIVCVLCMLCAAVMIIVRHGKIRIIPNYIKWLINISLIFISLLISRQQGHAFNTLLMTLIIMGIAVTSVYEVIDVNAIIKILVWFSIAAVAITILEIVFTGPTLNLLSIVLSRGKYEAELLRIRTGQGYRGLAEYPNVLSIASATILFYAFWLVSSKSNYKKVALILIAIIGIIITGERSNLIIIPFASMMVYFLYGKRERVNRILKVIGIIIVMTIIFFSLRPMLVQYRFFTRLYNLVDLVIAGSDIWGGRQNLNDTALSLWLKSPVIGNGWFYYFYNNMGILHGESYSHAHNFIFELLCDSGIVGLFLALIPIVSSLYSNIRLIKGTLENENLAFKFTLALQIFFITDSLLHVTFYSLNMIGLYFIVVMLFYTKVLQVRNQTALDN